MRSVKKYQFLNIANAEPRQVTKRLLGLREVSLINDINMCNR